MEERAPAGNPNDDPPIKPSNSNDKLPPRPSTAPVKSTETYVVQIPRDVVYRIPPPENAGIVESYRKPINEGTNACSGGRWIFIILALMLIGLVVFLTISNFSNPKLPEFSIIHFAGIASKPQHLSARNNSSAYEISLHIFNPNKRMDVHYGVGNMTLSFKGHEIGYGESKLGRQEARTSITVAQSLHSITKGKLPDVVEKSMDDKHPKVLILKFDLPVEVKTWEKTFKKEMIVGCNLQVDSLGHAAKILSQKCETN